MRERTPVGADHTRLVVLRGNSGAGKSTVAERIRAERPIGSVVVLGQDVVRRTILGTGTDDDGHATAMIDTLVRLALARGLDVVLEGILNPDWYAEALRRLAGDHRGRTRCYLFDVPFDETLRRHATKPVADAFGEAEMRQWWRDPAPIDGLAETALSETDDLDGTVTRILRDTWDLPPTTPAPG